MSWQQPFGEQLSELKEQSLKRLFKLFAEEFWVRPVMALELEFYVRPARQIVPQVVLATVDQALKEARIAAHPAEVERGPNQYEVALCHTDDPAELQHAAENLHGIIQSALAGEGASAIFSPRPYREEPGSGLHIHIHLEQSSGRNLFSRHEEGHYSRELLWSLGGLLELLPESMAIFAPHAQSYERFLAPVHNAPTTLSWGPNNRTVALRLPNKSPDSKHIEHRISGSDADPLMAVLAVLAGVLYGMHNQPYPGSAIHGNASHPQYELDSLPDYEQALELINQSEHLPALLGEELYAEFIRRLLYPAAF